MQTLPIYHSALGARGRYWVNTDSGEAELVYFVRPDDDVIIINNTYVPPDARNGRIALALVQRVVDDARASGRKIVPKCPDVARFFERRTEWADVRAAA